MKLWANLHRLMAREYRRGFRRGRRVFDRAELHAENARGLTLEEVNLDLEVHLDNYHEWQTQFDTEMEVLTESLARHVEELWNSLGAINLAGMIHDASRKRKRTWPRKARGATVGCRRVVRKLDQHVLFELAHTVP